jgi:hypothetical protein
MNRNLGNNAGDNATSIVGYPILDTTAPMNGQVIEFSSAVGGWVYNSLIPGEISTGANVGGGPGQIYAGVAGDTINFNTIAGVSPNITVSTVANVVNIGLASDVDVTNLTASSKVSAAMVSAPIGKFDTIEPDVSGETTFTAEILAPSANISGTLTAGTINATTIIVPSLTTPTIHVDEIYPDTASFITFSTEIVAPNASITSNLSAFAATVSTLLTTNNATVTGNLSADNAVFTSLQSTTGLISDINTTLLVAATNIETPMLSGAGGTGPISFSGCAVKEIQSVNASDSIVSELNLFGNLSFEAAGSTVNNYFQLLPGTTTTNFQINDSGTGVKYLSYNGLHDGTPLNQFFKLGSDASIYLGSLASLYYTPTPTYVLGLNAGSQMCATSILDIGANIYNSDGTLLSGSLVSNTRTITLPVVSSEPTFINFSGGYLQNNYTSITGVNPPGVQSAICDSVIGADENGVFRGYSMTKTINSARISLDSMISNGGLSLGQCTNFYSLTIGSNGYWNGVFHLASSGADESVAMCWDVMLGFSVNDDEWITIPYRKSSGAANNGTGGEYALEYMNPSSNSNTFQFRIRSLVTGGAPTVANMTVVCRNVDYNPDGFYTLMDQTIYFDSTQIIDYENYFPKCSSQVASGQGIPAGLVFNAYGQAFMIVRYSTNYKCAVNGTLTCQLMLNGAILTTNFYQAVAGDVINISSSGYGAYASSLIKFIGFMDYAPCSTNTVSLNIFFTGAFDATGRFYEIVVEQSI